MTPTTARIVAALLRVNSGQPRLFLRLKDFRRDVSNARNHRFLTQTKSGLRKVMSRTSRKVTGTEKTILSFSFPMEVKQRLAGGC
jgi:hypothetical protein